MSRELSYCRRPLKEPWGYHAEAGPSGPEATAHASWRAPRVRSGRRSLHRPPHRRGARIGLQRLEALDGRLRGLLRRRLPRRGDADQRHLHPVPHRLHCSGHPEVLGLPQARPGYLDLATHRGLHGDVPYLDQTHGPAHVHHSVHARADGPQRRCRVRQDLRPVPRRCRRSDGAGQEPASRRGRQPGAHVRRLPRRRHRRGSRRPRGLRRQLRLLPQRHGPAEQQLLLLPRRQDGHERPADHLHQHARLRRRRLPRQGRQPRRHADRRRSLLELPRAALPGARRLPDLPPGPAELPSPQRGGAAARRLRRLPRRRHRRGQDDARDPRLLRVSHRHGAPGGAGRVLAVSPGDQVRHGHVHRVPQRRRHDRPGAGPRRDAEGRRHVHHLSRRAQRRPRDLSDVPRHGPGGPPWRRRSRL